MEPMSLQQAFIKPTGPATVSLWIEPGEKGEEDILPRDFALNVLRGVFEDMITEDEWLKFADGKLRLDFSNVSTPDGTALLIALV